MKDEFFYHKVVTMEEYGYDVAIKVLSNRYYDAEHEEVFRYRRMLQME